MRRRRLFMTSIHARAADAQADVRYGAARGWGMVVIDLARTREVLMVALEACALNTEVGRF